MVVLSDNICFGYRETTSADGFAGEPYYINRERIKDCHTHIRGGSGHGKSTEVANLVFQLCRPYDIWRPGLRDAREVVHAGVQDPVCVITNAKDLSLFHQVRLAAEANGRTFRYFTMWPERSAFVDTFQFVERSSTPISQTTDYFMKWNYLDGGLGHGKHYYTTANANGAARALEPVIRRRQAGEHVTLLDVIKEVDRNKNRDQEHIKMILKALEPYTQLQPRRGEENTIDFCRAIRDKEVICGIFPALTNAGPARQLAGIMTFGFIYAAQLVSATPGKPIVIIDEMQQLCGLSFGQLFEQARKHASIMVAHQNTSQLNRGDVDLTEIVESNTDIKVHLTFAEKERDQLLAHSRESRGTLGGQVIDSQNKLAHSEREYLARALDLNTVLDIDAQRLKGYIIDKTSGRHVEPTPIRLEHPISREIYERIKEELPPLTNARKKERPAKNRKPQAVAAKRRPQSAAPVWQKELGALMERKQAAFRVEQAPHKS